MTVAHERVDEAQRNLNNSMMTFGVSVIPATMTMVTGISTLMGNFPGIAETMSGAFGDIGDALESLATNPVALIVIGIVALAIGLYEAYEHCKPFRDAVNEIGAVLGGALKTALTDIYNALNWLWQMFWCLLAHS